MEKLNLKFVLFLSLFIILNLFIGVNLKAQSTNIALGSNPMESDPGWGGGSYPMEIVDGKRVYCDTWAHGLAFCGGQGNWCGQPCGWHQATINFGSMKIFNHVLVWHHGDEHIPSSWILEYWDGSTWVNVGGTSSVRWDLRETCNWDAVPTENIFPCVTGSKVRFRFDNCNITHGWIYEFEVFNDQTNNTPIVNAGENITIKTIDKWTTIFQGSASDPDQEDTLQYRWKEGESILLDWTGVGGSGECPLNLASTSLGIGTHTLILEVTDGIATVTDEMILTIENSAPHAAPSGSGVYEINSNVTLGGNVSDYDGDSLTYKWLEGETVLFKGYGWPSAGGDPIALPNHSISTLSLGIHTITLQVSDAVNTPVSSSITVKIVDTMVPTLAPVANQTILWPPNHEMVDITIQANAADNSGSMTLAAAISSNEPIDGLGDGDQAPDWTKPVINQQTGLITFQLRAERSGTGKGRIYTITISATDNSNNTSTANLEIIVPHDKKK